MDKRKLKAIFGVAVDGANCNAFYSLGKLLRQHMKGRQEKIMVSTLAKVLDELSEDWEKEIEETINAVEG